MQKRKLGNSGLDIAPIVFGGNVFGWTADQATSFALLDAFVDAGFDCIDTANVYSRWVSGHQGGESETIIGAWLKQSGKRRKVVLATKVGMEMGPGREGLSKAAIVSEVELSLKRLQTDYIDLYQSHADDAATPVHETLEAFSALVRQGKVRTIGASNFSAARLAESIAFSGKHDLPRYESLQPHYNLSERGHFEGDLEALCLKENIGVITYFSLASGFLTGKYRSKADTEGRARSGGVQKYVNERGLRILAAMDEVSAGRNASLTRIALAWLLAKPAVTAPIVSATSLAQLHDVLGAVEVTLDKADIEKLDAAGA